MANVIKTVQDLIPGKEYIVRVRAKNTDLNTYSNATDSIRFTVPQDGTVPGQVQNLSLYSSFQTVMFVYDFNSDNDISHYEYELYYGTLTAGEPTGELHSQGIASANVFTVAVENSTTDTTTGVSDPVTYSGRMRAVDLTGNIGQWSTFAQSDKDTPLIDEEFIASLTAAKITAGTIGAHEIILTQSGAVTTYDPPGNVAVLRSSNYSTGSAGWLIRGDGFAEFDSTHVRGNLDAGSITVGDGTYNYWNKTGAENDFRVGDASTYLLWDNSAGTLTVAGNATISGTLNSVDGTFSGTLSAVDGTFSGTLSGVGGTFTSNVTVGSHATNKITIASNSTASGTKIYSGAGTYSNSNTGFYLDASGRFSLKNKFVWDGSSVSINGTTATSDVEINGAIVTGGIIRTNSDTDNNDAVAIQEDRIYIYNRGGGAGEIRFESDNSTDISKIVASTGGVSFECDSQTGDATFINGANSSRPQFNWKGWGGVMASMYQSTNSGGQVIFDINGSSSSYLSVQNLKLKNEGSSSNLSIYWDEDLTTGIYRYNPGSSYTGVSLVAVGTEVLAAISQSGSNPRVFIEAPSTTSSSGYRFLLRSSSGFLTEYSSNRDLKENIETISDVSSFFENVRPVRFAARALDPDSETLEEKNFRLADIQHGFIAEEIADIFDGKLATYDADFNPNGWRWPDMIALCVTEIKSLRKRVAQLESL